MSSSRGALSDKAVIEFLVACIKGSEAGKPNWPIVGAATGLTKDAARMRYKGILTKYDLNSTASDAAGVGAALGAAIDAVDGTGSSGAASGATPKTKKGPASKVEKKRATPARKSTRKVVKAEDNEEAGAEDGRLTDGAEEEKPKVKVTRKRAPPKAKAPPKVKAAAKGKGKGKVKAEPADEEADQDVKMEEEVAPEVAPEDAPNASPVKHAPPPAEEEYYTGENDDPMV